MIQHVRGDGWTRQRSGHVKRWGGCAALSFVGAAAVVGALLFPGSRTLAALVVVIALFALGALVAEVVAFRMQEPALAGIAPAELRLTDLLWRAVWGPGAVVSVSRAPVHAGESFSVRCAIGHPERVREVTVTWQGREETVLHGYAGTTFGEPFLRQELADPLSGPKTIEIPRGVMPSFSGKHARIIWSIYVESRSDARITRDDFPVTVLPARPRAPERRPGQRVDY